MWSWFILIGRGLNRRRLGLQKETDRTRVIQRIIGWKRYCKSSSCMIYLMCSFERTVYSFIFLDSSMVEHSAVNRVVVGSSPTRGVFFFLGTMVKRLRHRPFTAVTRVQIPLESFLAQQCAELKVISRMPMWLNWQSSWFVISRLSVRVRSSAYIFGPLAQLVRATGS